MLGFAREEGGEEGRRRDGEEKGGGRWDGGSPSWLIGPRWQVDTIGSLASGASFDRPSVVDEGQDERATTAQVEGDN